MKIKISIFDIKPLYSRLFSLYAKSEHYIKLEKFYEAALNSPDDIYWIVEGDRLYSEEFFALINKDGIINYKLVLDIMWGE